MEGPTFLSKSTIRSKNNSNCAYLFGSPPSHHLAIGSRGWLLRGQLYGRHRGLRSVVSRTLTQEDDTHIVAHAVRTEGVHVRYRAHLRDDCVVVALIPIQRAHDHNELACQAIAFLGGATKIKGISNCRPVAKKYPGGTYSLV